MRRACRDAGAVGVGRLEALSEGLQVAEAAVDGDGKRQHRYRDAREAHHGHGQPPRQGQERQCQERDGESGAEELPAEVAVAGYQAASEASVLGVRKP